MQRAFFCARFKILLPSELQPLAAQAFQLGLRGYPSQASGRLRSALNTIGGTRSRSSLS